MLSRPASCDTCVLNPVAQGFMVPEGRPALGVTLMGEALGEIEAQQGRPFVGAAGFRFGAMIERAGFTREQFQILNAVWCRPPHNSEPETAAIEHCRQYWEPIVARPETKVIVPLGNVPLFATLGEEGILSKRGYVWWSEQYQAYVLPTVHPSFILRGNHNWEAAWLYDLRHAVEIAAEGWRPVERAYTLDPPPQGAQMWAQLFVGRLHTDPTLALGTDIETPDKTTAEDETDINLGYLPGPIHRIGFAYVWEGRTLALTIPWDVNYLETITFLLGLVCRKVFWYRHFDVPRIKAHGVHIAEAIHDGAEAWHVLHSDLPKKLEHVTPFLCPTQPAWKHLNYGGHAARYNATDASVQVEGFYRIEALLTTHGMIDLYLRDIHGLNPILTYMGEQGMPVDAGLRMTSSQRVMALKEANRGKLNEAAQAARPSKVYKKRKAGLEEITLESTEKYCTECGKARVSVKHPHFKVGTADGEVPLGNLAVRAVVIKGWVQPLDFKPSQKGLIRYAQYRGYKLYVRWDRETQSRKVSMDETSVRRYALAHPDDPVWLLALEERELGKLLSTYIGRVTTELPKTKTAQDEWYEAWKAAQYRESPTPQDRWLKHEIVRPQAVPDDDIPF